MNIENVSSAMTRMYNSLPQTLGFNKNVNVVKEEAAMGVVAFRLHPGDDLRKSLLNIVTQHYQMDAAIVLTCVGNLRKCRIKLPSQVTGSTSSPNTPVASAGLASSPFSTARPPNSPEYSDPSTSSGLTVITGNGNGTETDEIASPSPLHQPGLMRINSASDDQHAKHPGGINIPIHGGAPLYCVEENFEIVSLVGTLSGDSKDGDCNLNIALADKTGNVIGGKLLDGCEVYRTAEIILGKIMGMRFRRKYDKETGYFELAPDVISPIT